MGSLTAAACLVQAQTGGGTPAPAELHAMATSNDEWVQFPARPGPSAPKVQNDKPKAARSTPPVTPATDDGWIKFPPLPPPKPASTAKTDEFAPVQSTDLPNQVVTPATAPAPAARRLMSTSSLPAICSEA